MEAQVAVVKEESEGSPVIKSVNQIDDDEGSQPEGALADDDEVRQPEDDDEYEQEKEKQD